jgi:hypothetical protein
LKKPAKRIRAAVVVMVADVVVTEVVAAADVVGIVEAVVGTAADEIADNQS